MTDTFSPVLHRIDQAIRWRAVHPTEPVPPPYDILTRYSHPPEDLLSLSKRQLEKLKVAANVKKGMFRALYLFIELCLPLVVPPKVQGRRRNRNEIKPLSGLNVEALLGGGKKTIKISSQNAIPDFRRALDNAESIEGIPSAARQLAHIIEARIKDSFGDIAYARAIEEITALREEMSELEEPEIYNNFARDLKRKLLSEELGGNRKDFWWEFRKSKLGLIDSKVSENSGVTEEDAKLVRGRIRS